MNTNKKPCDNTHNLYGVSIFANIFEWYEFLVYGYLSSIIGRLFFKDTQPIMAVIQTFAIFAMSYLIRPIGGLFFGYLSDTKGRSVSLKCSLLVMAIPTILIGILPTYASIGILAPISLLILRLIQGFAAGGELPGSACYVYEASPSNARSILCAAVAASSTVGALCGSLIASSLFWIFDYDNILEWAWRIPFWLGIPIAWGIFSIRKSLYEPQGLSLKEIDTRPILTLSKLTLLKASIICAFLQVSYYVCLVWWPTYLIHFLKVSPQTAQLTNTLTLCIMLFFYFPFAYLARFCGFMRLIKIHLLVIILAIYPIFLYLNHIRDISFGVLLAIQCLLALLICGIDSVMWQALASLFPSHFRGRGMNIAFTFPTALFGGTAPLVCTYIIQQTGLLTFPALYIVAFGFLALLAVLSINRSLP